MSKTLIMVRPDLAAAVRAAIKEVGYDDTIGVRSEAPTPQAIRAGQTWRWGPIHGISFTSLRRIGDVVDRAISADT